MVLQDRSEVGIPSTQGEGGGLGEDRVPDSLWKLRVRGDAVWAQQHVGSIHGPNESSMHADARLFSYCVHR